MILTFRSTKIQSKFIIRTTGNLNYSTEFQDFTGFCFEDESSSLFLTKTFQSKDIWKLSWVENKFRIILNFLRQAQLTFATNRFPIKHTRSEKKIILFHWTGMFAMYLYCISAPFSTNELKILFIGIKAFNWRHSNRRRSGHCVAVSSLFPFHILKYLRFLFQIKMSNVHSFLLF